MFNLLPHRLSGLVVDLFAGSGALGLEALSRGAERAVFADCDRQAIRSVRMNLEYCHATDLAEVWMLDWRLALQKLQRLAWTIDWVFLDPPYADKLWLPVMSQLSNVHIVGGVVCESPKTVVLPDDTAGFVQMKRRTYGDIAVSIYKPADELENPRTGGEGSDATRRLSGDI